jgi:predicted ester cyclase
MSEDIKTKFLRVVDEAWNQRNLDTLDELHTADYIEHRPPFQDVIGLEAFKQTVAGAHITFPDFHITIEDILHEKDKLAVRFSWTGTHSNSSQNFPMPPTGKKLTVTGVHFLCVKGDKLVEGWQFADNLGIFQQLGLIPKAG